VRSEDVDSIPAKMLAENRVAEKKHQFRLQ
jgi:hypothetical protein